MPILMTGPCSMTSAFEAGSLSRLEVRFSCLLDPVDAVVEVGIVP